MKFLTKQEVVDALNALPDLPIVIERDSDVLRSTGIQSVEVKNCTRGSHCDDQGEYDDFIGKDDEGKPIEKVIWIS
jgi:hypothetical protein